MTNKRQMREGWSWCEKCQAPAAGGICSKHQLDRPVTLNRYDAKVLYDLAVSLGIERAYKITEHKDVIHDLVVGLETGQFTIVPVTLTPAGFKAGQ